ncbi:hypothetical protein [Dactylosporangium sp. NPDC051541]|uniref:hypothetical protein n=1 Tax=Dactylosporangium sp. NPDC051541 TaxID=3363977 RepID=UPI003792DAC1
MESVIRKLTLAISAVAALLFAHAINNATDVSLFGLKLDSSEYVTPSGGVLSMFLCYRYQVTFNRLALIWQIQHEMIRAQFRPFCDQGLDEVLAPVVFQGSHAARWSDFLAENRRSARVRIWIGRLVGNFPGFMAVAIALICLVPASDQSPADLWPFWVLAAVFATLVALENIPLNPEI